MNRLAILAVSFSSMLQPALADGTREQFASAFKAWCGTGAPSFDVVSKKAAEKKLNLDSDLNPPIAGGKMLESKTWANADQTGSYAVNASRAVNRGKHVRECSIYFPDINEDLTDYLSGALAIGNPHKRAMADDGKHLSYWNGPSHTIFMLASGPAGSLEGATLNSIQTLESGQ